MKALNAFFEFTRLHRGIRVLPAFFAIALFAIAAPASADSGIVGRTTVGTIPSAGLSADFKRGSKFTLSERGTLQSFCAYLDGQGGVTGTQTVRFAAYKDANGTPGQKIVESRPLTIASNYPPNWWCANSDRVPVTAGDYWLVIQTGAQSGVIRDYADGTGNWYGNADAFTDGASAQFGSGNVGNGTLTIETDFTAATEVDYVGRLDVAKTPSGGLSANYKRGSQITIRQAGRLEQMSMYVDTAGGASGTQDLRLVLYNDVNGKPNAKLAESDTLTLSSGSGATWVGFLVTPVLLDAGRYWLMLHTGNTGGVLRDFGDGAPNFYTNADTFSDGASQTFGTGNTGTVTLSGYVSYHPGSYHTKTFGRTTVATVPSGGMTVNFKRASYAFVQDQDAALTGLYAYLDGRGGASGSQQLRMALYRETKDHGAQEKLVESDVVTIPAGTAPGWVHFPVQTIRLDETYGYWIALQSGANGGVARNYGDGDPNWIGNTDGFADGANPRFGAASAGTVTISMYGTYNTKNP
ncbi:MAG: hypothetical protein WDO68_18900 [Gammaproteobacteria bacterium]